MSHKLIQLAAKMFERDEETAERERGGGGFTAGKQ